MKETGTLFKDAMVRAILAYIKTQTRRGVTKLAGFGQVTEFGVSDTPGYDWRFRDKAMRWHDIDHTRLLECCQYGWPGDRLWVREHTNATPMLNFLTGEPTSAIVGAYSADGEPVLNEHGFDFAWWYSKNSCPSIHMPRWASRITLEIVSVRVERLQDISEQDAQAEGAAGYEEGIDAPPPDENHEWSFRASYRRLWVSINGAGSWDADPWVWVIEFRRIAEDGKV